jgi:predicted HTH transcriptional regulator
VFEIFTDRIVITSAGGLPQELSQEEFFEGISAPRNKELMRVFKDVRLVEQLGSGVHRILRHYDKSIFKFSPNFLRVTFSIKNVGENVGENAFKLNNTQKQIILLIQSNKYITQLEMSEQLNKTVRTIQRNMRVYNVHACQDTK